jgi:hypothetical protein
LLRQLIAREIAVKKPFLFALGLVAITAAACGGKVVVESSGGAGTGGAGGTSTTLTTADGAPNPVTTVGVVTVGVAVAAATSVTTGTGTTGCDPNYTCAEAIDPASGDASKLCDGTVHAKLYDALVQCICVDTCQVECAGSVCTSGSPSSTCSACIQNTMSGCGNPFNACANDI